MRDNNKQEEQSKGVSFVRLTPFLSNDLKAYLVSNEDKIKKFFNVTSDEAVRTLVAVMRDDLIRNSESPISTPQNTSFFNKIFQ